LAAREDGMRERGAGNRPAPFQIDIVPHRLR
jgi:hypothetical protein